MNTRILLISLSLMGSAISAEAQAAASPSTTAETKTDLAGTSTASITGAADPGAQVIVLGLDGNKAVIGVMGRADGTYAVEHLAPGRYSIKEDGPHHAARTLTLLAGQVGHVDLAPAKK